MEKNDLPTSFGVFKPVGHVVASFASDVDTLGAEGALRQAGFADADITHYTPAEMVAQADRDIEAASAFASVGQELNLVKAQRELALQGHRFLVVRAASDEQVSRVADIARRFHAARAQRYGRLLIEELIDVGTTDRQEAESPDRGLDRQTEPVHGNG